MDEITQIDLNHYQGTDKDFIFEIVNDDEEETAYNGLSNASFEMWIKPSRGETIKLSTRTGEITVKDNVIVVSIRNMHTASDNAVAQSLTETLNSIKNRIETLETNATLDLLTVYTNAKNGVSA